MKALKVIKMMSLSALVAISLLNPVLVFADESEDATSIESTESDSSESSSNGSSSTEESNNEEESNQLENESGDATTDEINNEDNSVPSNDGDDINNDESADNEDNSSSSDEGNNEEANQEPVDPYAGLPTYVIDSSYTADDQLVIPEGGVVRVTEDATIGNIYSQGDIVIIGVDGAVLHVANTSFESEHMSSHPGIVAKGSITIKDAQIIDNSDGVAISDVSGSKGGINIENSTIVVEDGDSTRIYGICSIEGISIESSTISVGSNYSECGIFAFGNIVNRNSELSIQEGGKYTIMSASVIDLGDDNYVLVPEEDKIVQVLENKSFAYNTQVSTVSAPGSVTIISRTPEPEPVVEPEPEVNSGEPEVTPVADETIDPADSNAESNPTSDIIENIVTEEDMFVTGLQVVAQTSAENPNTAVAYNPDGSAVVITQFDNMLSTSSVSSDGTVTGSYGYSIKDNDSLVLSSVESTEASVDIPASITLDGITYSVTGIDSRAFKNNTTIETVNIGNNVTEIGSHAFEGCSNLKTIVIRDSITSVGKKAFHNIAKDARLQVIGSGDLRPLIKSILKESNSIKGVDIVAF